MALIQGSNVDGLSKYETCPNCGSDDLQFGGRGDWFNSIMCRMCFHTQDGIPFEGVIVPLESRKRGISQAEAREVLQTAHDAYLATVAEQSNFG